MSSVIVLNCTTNYAIVNCTIRSSRNMAFRIVAAFILPRGLAQKSEEVLTDAARILRKNFASHHTTSWSSTSTAGWYAGMRAQGRWCTAQTLRIPTTTPALRTSSEKTLFLTDVYISTSAPTTHFVNARGKR